MNLDNSTITVIPLATAFLSAPFLSSEIISVIEKTKDEGKKSLLFYNRRGSARAWICQDCGFFEKCPHCDIAFAYHKIPKPRLICHQCNTIAPFPIHCPNCNGNNIVPVGVGIQKIEEDLQRILNRNTPNKYSILRIDSDLHEKSESIYEMINKTDIILGTNMISTLIDPNIGVVIFLSFDSNLSIPEYDVEEQIFSEVSYYKRQNLPIYIQTYTPYHPLLQEILQGNTKSFLQTLTKERKDFSYPPFTEFATLRIHDEKKEKVTIIMNHLVAKILTLKQDSTFLAYDRDIWEKRSGEWVQKIIIKSKDLSYIIGQLEVEVVRNRSVTLEWG